MTDVVSCGLVVSDCWRDIIVVIKGIAETLVALTGDQMDVDDERKSTDDVNSVDSNEGGKSDHVTMLWRCFEGIYD